MRAQQVVPAGSWDATDEVGAVALDFEHRHRRQVVLRMEPDGELLVELPQAARLRHGDGLLLDGGGVVRVVAAEEPLLEIHGHDTAELVLVAWHLGSRHVPVQLLGDRIRVRADPAIAALVEGLGGHADPIEGPFDPDADGQADAHDREDG